MEAKKKGAKRGKREQSVRNDYESPNTRCTASSKDKQNSHGEGRASQHSSNKRLTIPGKGKGKERNPKKQFESHAWGQNRSETWNDGEKCKGETAKRRENRTLYSNDGWDALGRGGQSERDKICQRAEGQTSNTAKHMNKDVKEHWRD